MRILCKHVLMRLATSGQLSRRTYGREGGEGRREGGEGGGKEGRETEREGGKEGGRKGGREGGRERERDHTSSSGLALDHLTVSMPLQSILS